MPTGRHEIFEHQQPVALNMQPVPERPKFSDAIPPEMQYSIESLEDESWSKIAERFDDPASMESVDWTDTQVPMGLEARLVRLASIKANLPTHNRILQKDQHNITLENYKKLALATAGELSTLNVFLEILSSKMQADPSPEVAQAVFDIWGDTAELIGRHDIKTDLEERAFAMLMPEAYQTVAEAYKHLGGDEDMTALISDNSQVLGDIIHEEMRPGFNFKIDGRRKSYFSVWRKVEKDKRASYVLTDFLGLRIMVVVENSQDEAETLGDCYAVAGLISQIFTPDLSRYKDYIANPKPNGYRSLHLTVSDLNNAQIEFQIRTGDMHQQAESDPGVSHRAYDASTKITPGKHFRNLAKRHRIYDWRDQVAATIKQRLETGNESLEDLLPGTVLVFSDDNNLHQLNEGDSALDFAFAVHTRHALKVRYIRNRGSRANLDLDRPVQFGQILKLVTFRDRRLTWTDAWPDKVNSIKAKKALSKAARHRDEEKYIESGIRQLNTTFNTIMRHKRVRSKLNDEQLKIAATIQHLEIHELLSDEEQDEIAEQYGLADFEAVLRVIGQGSLGAGRLVNFARGYLGLMPEQEKPDGELAAIGKAAIEGFDEPNHKIAIHGAFGFKHHFADCCQINIGDEIRANWSQAKGDFSIHKNDCANLATKPTTWSCTWH